MPRKKKLEFELPAETVDKATLAVANVPSAVPDYIRHSKTYGRRTVKKGELPSFSEAMMVLMAPEALRLYWEALLAGLREHDRYALETAGEIFAYTRGRGISLTISQQLLQQNVSAGGQSPVMGFDAFARQLAEAREGRSIPPPIDITPRAESEPNVIEG